MNDLEAMAHALEQAETALGCTAPNPAVGAVLVANGRVIGRGHTAPVGGPHAEVAALADAAAAGHDARGATCYVTLEPCCHHGRTPPCTDALLAAGIARVVVAMVDPFPAMQGKGLQILRDAGVQVDLGVGARSAQRLVRGFCRTLRGGLPDVTLKVATSLDGCLSTHTGESQWITGEAARHHGHGLRASHDAILVGIGTVRADDPRLTCRSVEGRDPVPVVLDTALTIDASAKLFQSSRRPVIVCATDAPDRPELNAEIFRVPRGAVGVDLHSALVALGARGLHRILVEGGATVAGQFVQNGLVDDLMVYMASVLLPGGRPWLQAPALDALRDAPRFGTPDVTILGPDLLLHYELDATPPPAVGDTVAEA